MSFTARHSVVSLLAISLAACSGGTDDPAGNHAPAGQDPGVVQTSGLLPYEAFELENGLDVIFHVDRSDPVVAVSLTAHVGSAREVPGRTGFAHLFEHLLFLESENLGKGGLDKLSARIGGSGANGSTSRDRTNYLQTVPNNALEKMLWAEADKLGWFINTVTEPVLAKEKQVVKNEKRQAVDNQPYGHVFSVLRSNMYPEDHPYNWEVIGSLDDLQAATLDDVKTFYRNWYTPNNVTLVVAGDFDTEEARAWVEKYFAEIPRGPDIVPLEPRAAVLEESKSFFHEDNFAEQPMLTMAWPGVEQYNDDSYALDILLTYLTVGKRAPLNEVLIDEKGLSADVNGFNVTNELAGEAILSVTAFEGVDLDEVAAALDEAMARFEADGVSEEALSRIKIEQEVAFYQGLEGVLGKGASLAQYGIFANDPGYIDEDLAKLQAVTEADVRRVYETYIKDKPFIAASFVPKGAPDLALEGAVRANVTEEEVVQGAEETFDPNIAATYELTPSEIDRSVEPPAGPAPVLATPDIWEGELANGMKLLGIEDTELPLVEFRLAIKGGHSLDTVEQNGAANLLAAMMTRGTQSLDAAAFEEAVADLGADIQVNAGADEFVISGQTLARNFEPLMGLLEDMLLAPRWDEAEFTLAKNEVLAGIVAANGRPNDIAARASAMVAYGADDIRAHSARGSASSVEALTLDDLRVYYNTNLAPGIASLRIVGDVAPDEVRAALTGIETNWTADAPALAPLPAPAMPETASAYFYDVPGAKQSVLSFRHTGPARTDAAFYPATVANYILGGGGFASRLTQELRETKGYTYGIFSFFDGNETEGSFNIGSGVRSNATLEATQLVRDIMVDYADTFTEDDLAVTKSFFINSKARSFESYNAKLGLLTNVDRYDMPYNYVERENEIVADMTVEEIRRLIETHIRPNAMDYVIVGDAETQLSRLDALGIGEVEVINAAVDALSD